MWSHLGLKRLAHCQDYLNCPAGDARKLWLLLGFICFQLPATSRITAYSQLWISKPAFQAQKALLDLWQQLWLQHLLPLFCCSDTLHCPFQPRGTSVAAAAQCGAQGSSWAEKHWSSLSPHFPFAISQLDTFPRLEPCTSTGRGDHKEAPAGGQEQGTWNSSCWRESLKIWPSSNTLQKNKFLSVHPHTSRLHSHSPGLIEWNVYSINPSSAEAGRDTQSISTASTKVQSRTWSTRDFWYQSVWHPQALDVWIQRQSTGKQALRDLHFKFESQSDSSILYRTSPGS